MSGRERGSGTVLWVGVIGALVAVAWLVAALGSALLAAGEARRAADAAALAGAQVVLSGGDPARACARAGELAAANGARLVACSPGADDLQVEVEVAPGLRLGPGRAHAVARAGDPAGQPFPRSFPSPSLPVTHPVKV